jgi:phosphoglycerate kinase
MDLPTLKDFDFNNKRVLLRVDYNTPLDEDGNVLDDKRIRLTLPTINYLLGKNASLIIITHVGRPKGEIKENLRTTDIAKVLSKLLKKPIKKMDYCIGSEVEYAVSHIKPGEIIMLENIRFYPEEKEENEEFAKKLAGYADVYVNDAFANCHRAHTSMTIIPKFLPSFAGLLVEKEVKNITKIIQDPEKPFIAVLGGVKLETKLPIINNIINKVDSILLGGAMVFTFLKAQNFNIGKSKCEEEFVDKARELLKKYNEKITLPTDLVVAEKIEKGAKNKIVSINEIPENWFGVDLGQDTINKFKNILEEAKTVLWNGTLGVNEIEPFNKATDEVAKKIAELSSTTVVGGGDTVAMINKLKLEDKITLVSSGGGAFLTFFSGGEMPALKALEYNYKKFMSSS